jgi:hypothetical protein
MIGKKKAGKVRARRIKKKVIGEPTLKTVLN